MKFGFHGINLGSVATPEAARQIVATAEKHNIDSIWVGDHVINATRISSQYPYSPTGTFPLGPSELVLEPLIFMAFLAGQTNKIQIGISVLIVPYRNPVVTAKAMVSNSANVRCLGTPRNQSTLTIALSSCDS